MSSRADWMVVAGFLLAAFGVSLRIFMMMRSSDAHPANVAPKTGRDLLRSYGSTFPKSRLPLAMWVVAERRSGFADRRLSAGVAIEPPQSVGAGGPVGRRRRRT